MRKKAIKVAVVGATGLVGQTMVNIIKEMNIDAIIVPFNSKTLCKENIINQKFDFALMAVPAETSLEYAPLFASQGAIVIDNSSAYRRDKDKPLVVPEVNFDAVGDLKIISNPNCTTIGAVVALKPLDDTFGLKKVVYSTYQAISGAGTNPKFDYPIESNVIPYISGEEEKMDFETSKILGHNVEVFATCIRVPVVNCHTISVHAEFEREVDMVEMLRVLEMADGVKLCGDDELPMPLMADNQDKVLVGRIRVNGNCIDMVVCLDNIRKGAATNAVQIMKGLLEN